MTGGLVANSAEDVPSRRQAPSMREGHLLIVSTSGLDEMLAKGNIAYLSYYQLRFETVTVLYLGRSRRRVASVGGLQLISSSGFLAPVPKVGMLDGLLRGRRLIKQIIRNSGVTEVLTADMIYSWFWASSVHKQGLSTTLVPVTIPPTLHESGASIAGLPPRLERALVRRSLSNATQVLVSRSAPAVGRWLSEESLSCRTRAVAVTVEEVPPSLDALATAEHQPQLGTGAPDDPVVLTYVGRLSRDKLCMDLVPVVERLVLAGFHFKLVVIGDGPQRGELKRQLALLLPESALIFTGFISNDNMTEYLMTTDLFISPLTGTSLREAGLLGVPIIAYDMDWVSGFLRHEVDAYLVPSRDTKEMADGILRLGRDPESRRRLSAS